MARDTSKDGFTNKLRSRVLTSARPLWALTNRVPALHGPVNRYLIGNAIDMSRNRPHPLSTRTDYTSVESLRDKTYFARHLPAVNIPSDLPSLDAVAALFRRRGPARESNKSTMLFASFAQWFTDGFLLSNTPERHRNHSTHELDLANVYGATSAVTDALRLRSERSGERGRFKSQVLYGEEYAPYLFDDKGELKPEFAEVPEPLGAKNIDPSRRASLFAFGGERTNSTSQTSMFNTLVLREHNRLSGELEGAHPEWDDERVFQTARNVVTLMLLQIVIGEYINHIHPYHHAFTLDPSASWKAHWNRPVWFAVEFNMLYRWHSLIPDEIHWGDRTYGTREWLLDNRPLLESGLAQAFESSSKQRAGEIGLFNTPEALLQTERSAIEQGRVTRLASYNDYREAMKYPRVDRFEQISGSPEVVEGLRKLYKTVDRVEFYVGLFAEDARPNAAVPSLLGRIVAMDALSQALINPLCSEHVYNEQTFSKLGMRRIRETRTLADLVARNVKGGSRLLVTMTQRGAASKPGATSTRTEKNARGPLRELARSEAAE